MAAKGFYHTWPEEYLTGLFNHRADPRWAVISLQE
jgi:hypothetical protein